MNLLWLMADKGLTLADMVRKYREELVGEANYARLAIEIPTAYQIHRCKAGFIHSDCIRQMIWQRKGTTQWVKPEMWYVVDADKGETAFLDFPSKSPQKNIKSAC